MGIPCLYYGTEQSFDGAGDNDRYLRECMFGGAFGSLQSTALRSRHLALRRGRQYLREISESGEPGSFGLPHMIGDRIRAVVPWSRLFDNREILLAINTDADSKREAWVTIDASLHAGAGALTCLYSTDAVQVGATTAIEARNGRAVRIAVPAGGFVAYG